MKLASTSAIVFLLCIQAFALNVKTDVIKNKAVFGITFPSGNSLYMTSSMLASISKHSYLCGPVEIHELVLDALGGNSQIRIYCATPPNLTGMAASAAENAPGRLQNVSSIPERMEAAKEALTKKTDISTPSTDIVYKHYPNTTHARTIEYSLDSIAELDSLYQALAKDFAGADTNYKTSTSSQEKMPDKNLMGGKLYEVQSAKELKVSKK